MVHYTSTPKHGLDSVGFTELCDDDNYDQLATCKEPIAIRAQELTYTIGEKHILDGITADFVPGELVALMGPSGAGKTTLLKVLSGRYQKFVSSGSIAVNGKPLDVSKFKLVSNMIPQDDTLLGMLTPRETLTCATELLAPARAASIGTAAFVQEILEQLRIDNCADVRIGNVGEHGISGGQRKRVSIALELVNNPSCLFVDEPTSGLDSTTAAEVVKTLSELAHSGRTIICTIHQPSYDSFKLFDRLLLLNKGKVAYHGKVEHAVPYFAEQGYTCPQYANAPDYFMDTLEANEKAATAAAASSNRMRATGGSSASAGTRVKSQKEALLDVVEASVDLEGGSQLAPVELFTDIWAKKQRNFTGAPTFTAATLGVGARNQPTQKQTFGKRATLDAVISSLSNYSGDNVAEYPTSFMSQFWTLWKRTWLVSLRDKGQTQGRVFQSVFIGILVGLIYFQQPHEQQRAQDRMAVLFLCVLVNIMLSLQQTIIAMPLERQFMMREYGNGTYRLMTWYLSRTMVTCILQILFSALYSVIVYFMVGFDPAPRNVLIFVADCCLSGCIGAMTGFVFGSLVSKVSTAQTLIGPIMMPLQLFSGFMVQPQNIPFYFTWLNYISFYGYSFQILVVNEFQSLKFDPCSVDQFVQGECPFGPTQEGQVQTGQIVLNSMKYSASDMGGNFAILASIFVVLYVTGYYIVKMKALSKSS